MADPLLARIEQRYDERYAVDTLVKLARTPADVPLGLNEIEPTDPDSRTTCGCRAAMVERLGVGLVESSSCAPRAAAIAEFDDQLPLGCHADIPSLAGSNWREVAKAARFTT